MRSKNTYLVHSVIAIVLGILALGFFYLQGEPINNGDFSRVFGSMGIFVPGWESFTGCYSISPAAFESPQTLMALLGMLVVKAIQLAGMNTLCALDISVILNTIFFTGLVLVWIKSGRARWPLFAANLLAYFLYSFQLKTLLEEAAILALAPWLALGMYRLWSSGRWGLFFVSSALLLMTKAQMLFLLPLLLGFLLFCVSNNALKAKFAIGMGGALSIVSLLFVMLIAGRGMQPVNQYNRFYNGVGWAAQDVELWPAVDFTARRDYFDANREELQFRSRQLEDSQIYLMGTSYWPDGNQLSAQHWSSNSDERVQSAFHQAFEVSSLHKLTAMFYSKPWLAVKYLKSTFSVAASSDYSLTYIFPRSLHANLPFIGDLLTTREILAKSCWLWMLGLAILAWAIKSRAINSLALILYYFIGAPLFVVLGDGFYEFEKHMSPYFMLFGVIAVLCVINRENEGCGKLD